MINQEKWIASLSIKNTRFSNIKNQINHDRWTNTIPKKNTHNSVHKYSLIAILFVCGLLFVSVVKNETRILQKEINNLETSINVIKYNLDQAIIDNEVITSPENISRLAKKYLESDLASYKKSQIKLLNKKEEISIKPEKTEFDKSLQKTAKDKKSKIQLIFAKIGTKNHLIQITVPCP